MIESLAHLSIENAVEYAEIDDESSCWIDFALDRYLARIGMTVKARPRAGAENFLVLLITPFGTAVTMRGGKRDAAGQVS